MRWKALPLFTLFFLSFIVFAKGEEIEPGLIVCTPESTDPFCMEIKTQEMYTTLYQTLAPGCEKQWKKTIVVDCSFGQSCYSKCEYWSDTPCSSGVSRTLTCEYDLCILQKYYKKSPNCAKSLVYEKTYNKGESVSVTSKISCSSSSDWKIAYYVFKEYEITGKPSCPTGDLRKVFVGCENRQKVYDVYRITYEPRSCTSKPYCEKKEEFLGKDYEDVDCCVNEDCPIGYVCSNYKCVQVEVPTPPTPPEKTCEDYGYISYPPICPPYSRAETITVDGLTCYTGRCIPEEKPTEALSIIIWIIIFGAIGYFAYRRFKR